MQTSGIFKILPALLFIGPLSCSKKEDTDAKTVEVNGSLQLSVKSVQSSSGSDTALALAATAPFNNYSVASGKPDTFNLQIVRMVLTPADGSANIQNRPIFDDIAGKKLSIKKSRIDLSDMFTNFACIDNDGVPFDLDSWYTNTFPTIDNKNESGEVNEYRNWSSAANASCECGFDAKNYPLGPNAKGECPPLSSSDAKSGRVAELEVPANTYKSVTIYYKRKAEVQGCVSGYFHETWGGTGSVVEKSTFCTQANLAMYDKSGGGAYTDFEDKTAELTSIDLLGANPKTEGSFPNSGTDLNPSEIMRIEFPIPGNIEISPDKVAQLTLAIDTNRILRFFSDHHSAIVGNKGPGPDAISDKSYFFTSNFKESQFMFVGQPGNIYGYELLTLPCSKKAKADIAGFTTADDYNCTNSDEQALSAWLTIIEDSKGSLLSANIFPDDDLSYVALKGSNLDLTYDSAKRSFDYAWGKNWTTNSDGTLNITYGLSSSTDNGDISYSLRGTLHNISKTSVIGAEVPNVYFSGENNDGVVYGKVATKRQL